MKLIQRPRLTGASIIVLFTLGFIGIMLPDSSQAIGAPNYGIATGSDLVSLSPAKLNNELQAVSQLGVGRIRFDLEWSDVQSAGSTQYNWAAYDRVVAAVTAHHLEPLLIIDYTPAWARSSACPTNPMCEPATPTSYASFAAAAARRYAPEGVHEWEIWNEPNTAHFFAPAADPTAYTKLLSAAYKSIKHVDNSAIILTGGTAPALTSNGNYSPVDFLQGIYSAGGKDSFTAVADHPYDYPATPTTGDGADAWAELSTLHAVMVRGGDGDKQIWATEYGAPTGGPGKAASVGSWNQTPLPGHVTEALQAQTAQSAISSWSKLSYGGPLFWYSIEDAGTSNSTSENFFGLLRANGSKKPAYNALKSAIELQLHASRDQK